MSLDSLGPVLLSIISLLNSRLLVIIVLGMKLKGGALPTFLATEYKTAWRPEIAGLPLDGRLLYETSRKMRMKKPEVILVRLDLGSSDIFEGINKAQFKLENVKISSRMRLHLTPDPPDAFKVEPASPSDEEQAMSNLSASTWMWNVTPLRPGDAKLILNVWALVEDEHGSKDKYLLLTKTETISVRATRLPEFNDQQFWDKALDKIAEKTGESITVLIGSALTGIGVWIWRKWRKPKEPKAPAWETP